MHFDSLAELALASRLHALSEQLYQSIDDVFQATGSTLQSRWIPILRFLRDHGPASSTDVCLALGLPHTTVNPLASMLVREGLVERRGTTGTLAATATARDALRQLEPTWLAIRRTVNRDYPGICPAAAGCACRYRGRAAPTVAFRCHPAGTWCPDVRRSRNRRLRAGVCR